MEEDQPKQEIAGKVTRLRFTEIYMYGGKMGSQEWGIRQVELVPKEQGKSPISGMGSQGQSMVTR